MNKKNFAPIGIRTIKYYPSHTNSNCIVTLLTGVNLDKYLKEVIINE